MKAVDLFCGAGGASHGLHLAGYDVHGYDHWQPAVDTHNANGLPATLLDLSVDDPPGTCDLLWASPPCQPFSAAGNGDGEFDGRDGFPWLLRIIERMTPRPPVVIVENVKGLTFAKHSDYFGGVLAGIRALGYVVDWCVLNCADLGVPQTRERCIIVARRDGGPITWPMPTHTEQAGMFTAPWVTMAEALGWGGELAYRRGAGMIEAHGERGPWNTAEIPAPTLHRNSAKDWILTTNQQTSAGGMYERDAERPAPMVTTRGDMWTLHYRQTAGATGELITCDVTDRPSPTVGTQSQSQWVIGVKKLMGAGMVERHGERPIRTANEPAFAVRADGGGRDPGGFVKVYADEWPLTRPATTIAGDTSVFQPGGHHKPGEQSENAIRLTIAELATLQGFPPDWIWTGNKTAQARQVGNAVPPALAHAVADVNRPIRQAVAA